VNVLVAYADVAAAAPAAAAKAMTLILALTSDDAGPLSAELRLQQQQ